MKRPYYLLLLIFLLLSCQNNTSKADSELPNSVVLEDEASYDNGADGCTYWSAGQYMDEFGDSTGEKYLHFNCSGNFSNSVSEAEPLRVEILVDKDEVYFKFYVYESKQLIKNRGLFYADVKFENGKIISFVLNNQGLGKTEIVKSTANPKQLRDMFLIDGLIKFHVTNDKIHPTAEYNFTYDGQVWDFEQSMQELDR